MPESSPAKKLLLDRRAAFLAAAVALLVAGCGGGPPTAEEPVTTPEDSADSGEATEPADGRGGVELVEIGSFDQPLYVTQPRSDPEHLYVVEQCGTVKRVPAEGGGEGETFLDVSDRISCGGEQGLLSLAFAPDYERSGRLYVDYTDTEGTTKVIEFTRAGGEERADPQSAREILSIPDFAENHNGGLLLFGPDGELYLGTGDGGGSGDPERTAQDRSSLLGKLLRIDPGAAAPNAAEIVAVGLRNPWRYSFDRETDDLWIGDVGQDEIEEIDSVTAAEFERRAGDLNFGWSAFEGRERFNTDQTAPGAIDPTLEYGRDGGCSVTGGYVVRDPALASLLGRYLYGDFCAGELRSFPARAGEPARDDVALGLTVPQLSSFGEDVDGRIYATSLEGPVYRLVPQGSD